MTKTNIDPHRYKRMLSSASTPHESKEDAGKKTRPDRTNMVIYGMLIALVLLAGAIYLKDRITPPPLYYYSNGDSEFEVRRISDTQSQIQFYYENRPEPYAMDLRYGPRDLEDIKIDDKTIKESIKNDETVFITIDPKEELKGEALLAGVEVGKFISNKYFFNIPIKSAVTSDYANNTVMTCEDANPLHTVIWIRKGEKTGVISADNCIIIEGPTETDIVKAADRLALHLVGIMP